MAIDLQSEKLLNLAQVTALVPPNRLGKPVTRSCVLRWIVHGIKLPGGEIIRLEASRLGGRWITSREALDRFVQRQTPVFSPGQETLPERSPGQRLRPGRMKRHETAGV